MVSITEEGFIQKRRQKSSLLLGAVICALAIYCSSKDDLTKFFGKNIHFGRVVIWCSVNWKIIHSVKGPFFYSSISSNHPGAKSMVCTFSI